jgi:hypothetical protein
LFNKVTTTICNGKEEITCQLPEPGWPIPSILNLIQWTRKRTVTREKRAFPDAEPIKVNIQHRKTILNIPCSVTCKM